MDPLGIRELTARVEMLAAAVTEIHVQATSIQAEQEQHLCPGMAALAETQAEQAQTIAALAGGVEAILAELQRTRSREDRTWGGVERIELTLDAMIERARANDPTIPPYPKTQAEIPNLDQWRRDRAGQVALPGGSR